MLTLAVFLLFQTVHTRAEGFFNTEKNCVLFDETPISVKRADSLITCSQLCTRNERCKSANFIKDQRTCSLLDKTRKTHPQRFLKQANVIHLEKAPPKPGSTQEVAVPSCNSLSSAFFPSGVYWIDPDGGSHDNAFKVNCEMETDGGGWTLVWSYTFTDYQGFTARENAVTPRPSWPVSVESRVNVPVSTTPPMNETDYNAVEFLLWKQFGKEILIKSNINNWLVCSPGTGSLVEWQNANVTCKIVRRVAEKCPDGPPPSRFEGPSLKGGKGGKNYYYFDGCTGFNRPAHDPCGEHKVNHVKNVENPHGNIFVR